MVSAKVAAHQYRFQLNRRRRATQDGARQLANGHPTNVAATEKNKKWLRWPAQGVRWHTM
jgi:hypothetical protein